MIKNIIVVVILATLVADPIQALDLKLEPCEEVDKLVPDLQNCSRFYECSLSGWVGFACYPGLEFNPITLQCDYPENVNCPNNVEIPEQVLANEPCTVVDQLKPDPKNCSRFYECIEAGWWVGEPCNVGLLFNPDTLQCDYPENVTCAKEKQNNDAPEQAITNEPCTVVDQLKPDPKNCSRFYECIEAGWWVGEPCNVGLLFNPDTLQCDYPENVKCATEKQNNDEVRPCGPENNEEIYPDPSNCNGYLQCSPLGLVHVSCPANLRFNPVTSSCDWSWKVSC